MTVQEASDFFESLKIETTKKHEIKVYEKFLHILKKLNNKKFSSDEIQSIEEELDKLDLKSTIENRKKYFKKALSKFEKYLKEKFSLTSENYYTNLYGALGLSFGLLFGVAILSNFERSLGISFGLIGGMLIGSILGRNKDSQVKSAGNML